jgi:hypothetical protein
MMNAIHAAYWDAEFADALYSKTIRDLCGPTVTRWTWKLSDDLARNREILAAYRMKLDADARYLNAFRRPGHG